MMKQHLSTFVTRRSTRHLATMVVTIVAGFAATLPFSTSTALAIPAGAACQTDATLSQQAQQVLGDDYQDSLGGIIDDTLDPTKMANLPNTERSYQAPLPSGAQPAGGSGSRSGFGC